MTEKMKCLFYFAAAGLVLLSGCTVGPDYTPPETAVPDAWTQELTVQDANDIAEWWKTFDDPLLWSLIERAQTGSPDVRAAIARIDESRAYRQYTAGDRLPVVTAGGDYTRSRSSGNTLASFPGALKEHGQYGAGFDASWEIDVFGRIRRSIEYADGLLGSAVEDWRGVQAALSAEVAANYVELRTIQEELRYAMENIEIQQKTLTLAKDRFDAELVGELDVTQARQNLANTEAQVPTLQIARRQAINRLAVLLGTWPGELERELVDEAPMPALMSEPGVLIPAELLRRRPDIRSAERALAAQTARIGMATADLYPSFSLSGYFELQGTRLSHLGNWDSRAYSYGPGFRWRIFARDQIRSMIAVEEARTRQLLAAYESTVLQAVEETENTLTGYVQETVRRDALIRSVEAAKKSVEMSESLYKSGLTDFQTVLDSQRSLANQQDQLAISRGLILQRVIGLYKAMGGGWQLSNDMNKEQENTSEMNDEGKADTL